MTANRYIDRNLARWNAHAWATKVLLDPDGDQLWRDRMHSRCDPERGVSCPWCSDDDKARAKQTRDAWHEALLAKYENEENA